MTRDERKIRFDVALEIVQNVYSDYCKDQDMTREQCYDFNDLVVSMIHFSSRLGEEAKSIVPEKNN